MRVVSSSAYQWRMFFSGIVILFGLYLTSLYNYILFHSLAELFSIVVACAVFFIAWNSKEFVKNNYILFLGIAYLFIGVLDGVHMLSYKGMGVFQGYGESNLSTQLWIAARYMESITLFIAPFFIARKLRVRQLFYTYLFLTVSVLAVIFYWNIFPVCFVEGAGLTPFKKVSEYVISLILLASLYLLFQRRNKFDPFVVKALCASIILTIGAELAFTFYISVYGFSNLVGHIFKIVSFYLIYRALIYTGLTKPYSLMFKELSEKEKQYRQTFETNQAIKLIIDPACGAIVEANKAACDFYGYSKKELTLLKISEINVLSTDVVGEEMNLAKSMERMVFSFRHKLASGEIRDVEVFSGPVEYGQHTYLHSIIHDVTVRKRAEEELSRSEEKFRASFSTSPDAININRAEDGVYMDINEGFTKIMGYSRDEVIGKSSLEFNIWNDVKDRERLVSDLKRDGIVTNLEAEFRGKDGQIKTGLMSARLINIGKKGLIFSVTRDITEKKQAEKQLLKSERLYRQLVDNIAEQVWEVDVDGVYTFISPRTLDVYGLESKEVIGKTPFNFMPAEEAARVAEIFGRIKDSEEPFLKLENIAQHADGRLLHMETTGFPFFDKSGNLLGYRGTAIDVTERKQNELDTQTLVESTVGIIGQELFDVIVVKLCQWLGSNCAIIGEFRKDGSVKATAMILDGEPVHNYVYDLNGSPCAETARKCYCVYPENVAALFPDDPDLIELSAEGYIGISLEDRKGKAIGIVCVISRNKLHITKHTKNVMKIIGARVSAEIERIQIEKEKEKLELKLQQAERMETIGTLAGGIAHDFNNILFPIVGNAEMLLEDIAEDSPLRESVDEIKKSAQRAKDLVRQILTFSRQDKIDLKLVKIGPVVREALKLTRSIIPTTIEIKNDIDMNCGLVEADSTQIHQAVMNIITNAYQAMADTGGELSVSLKKIELDRFHTVDPGLKAGKYAYMTIADTGTGMDQSITQKIFDPFFTTKDKTKGTGLGLSVVHGIVTSLGGSIKVYSEPGKGSTFYVYFPLNEKGSEENEIETTEVLQRGTERILLIDDEEPIVFMEERMLKRMGYTVFSRIDSIDALETFRSSPDAFDLVITDKNMPKLAGDQLAVELIKLRQDIPIILCTGFSESNSEELLLASGIKKVLLKPVNMKELTDTIREVLDE